MVKGLIYSREGYSDKWLFFKRKLGRGKDRDQIKLIVFTKIRCYVPWYKTTITSIFSVSLRLSSFYHCRTKKSFSWSSYNEWNWQLNYNSKKISSVLQLLRLSWNVLPNLETFFPNKSSLNSISTPITQAWMSNTLSWQQYRKLL